MKPFSNRTFVTLCLLTAVHATIAQQPQLAPPPLTNIEQRFYTMLAEAAARTDLEKTKKSGGGGGGAFAEVMPAGGLVVGFEVWNGVWSGHPIIRGIRPIFQTAAGRVRGESHGSTNGKPDAIVEAKDGYAVAAMAARGGFRLDGIQILFWKLHPSLSRLDAEGSYKSDWIGGAGGGKTKHALSSDGRPVLGIYGASGAEIDRLGLIYVEPK